MSYICGRPEWADDEDCPLDTGEAENCEDCRWGVEEEEV